MAVIDKTDSVGSTFDLMITPIKGDGTLPDSLTLEVSRDKAYGLVQITKDVKVTAGSGETFLLSTSIFAALPETDSTSPIEFTVDEKLYVSYPNTADMQDVKFDFEYSDNPALFLRKPVVQPQYTFNQATWKVLDSYIEAASDYTLKKEEAESMSTVKLTLDPNGSAVIEATNGTDAFTAEIKLTNVAFTGTDAFECLLHPPAWAAAMLLGSRASGDVYVGMDKDNITFASDGMVLTHSIMNYPNFPTVMDVIKEHIQKPNDTFSSKINPMLFHGKLKYLENVGMTAKTWEPLFVVSDNGGTPLVKLKGFQSNGQAKIADKAILDITWKRQKDIRIPARLMLRSLVICDTLGLTDLFDIDGLPAVFMSNPERSCFILLAQEVSEG
jgi:hypothetical protein